MSLSSVQRSGRAIGVLVPPLGLPGDLCVPETSFGLIIFAHGSGSSRSSPRNIRVARALNASGFATLLFDLLAEGEEADRRNVFDISLLAERLIAAIDWRSTQADLARLPLGLFGASTGAAAALVAAARLGRVVSAVVSRGGRPDLAMKVLERVQAPTLLIVGSLDREVIALNEAAFATLNRPKALKIIPDASHLFSEPGALDCVIVEAKDWFDTYLKSTAART